MVGFVCFTFFRYTSGDRSVELRLILVTDPTGPQLQVPDQSVEHSLLSTSRRWKVLKRSEEETWILFVHIQLALLIECSANFVQACCGTRDTDQAKRNTMTSRT